MASIVAPTPFVAHKIPVAGSALWITERNSAYGGDVLQQLDHDSLIPIVGIQNCNCSHLETDNGLFSVPAIIFMLMHLALEAMFLVLSNSQWWGRSPADNIHHQEQIHAIRLHESSDAISLIFATNFKTSLSFETTVSNSKPLLRQGLFHSCQNNCDQDHKSPRSKSSPKLTKQEMVKTSAEHTPLLSPLLLTTWTAQQLFSQHWLSLQVPASAKVKPFRPWTSPGTALIAQPKLW